ncbi:hypothetical protein ACFX2J_014274 [Malus domestica]
MATVRMLLFLAIVYSAGIHVIVSVTDPNDAAILQSLKGAWQNTPPSWDKVERSLRFALGWSHLQRFKGVCSLCGLSPLPACSFTGTSDPSSAASSETVPSNPSQLPQTKTPNEQSKKQSRKGLSTGVIIVIVIVICVAMLVVVSFLMVHYCARDRYSSGSMAGSESRKRRSGSSYGADQKRVYANSGGGGDSDGTNATDRSKLFFTGGSSFSWRICCGHRRRC